MGKSFTHIEIGFWRWKKTWTQREDSSGTTKSNVASSNYVYTNCSSGGNISVGGEKIVKTLASSGTGYAVHNCIQYFNAAFVKFDYANAPAFGSASLRIFSSRIGSAGSRLAIRIGRCTEARADASVTTITSDYVDSYLQSQEWREIDITALIAAQRSGANFGLIISALNWGWAAQSIDALSNIELETDAPETPSVRGNIFVGCIAKQIVSRGIIINGTYQAQAAQGVIIGGAMK